MKHDHAIHTILLLLLLGLTALDAPLAAQTTYEWPVRVICDGVAQDCGVTYPFTVSTTSRLDVRLTLSEKSILRPCSRINVTLHVNGVAQETRTLGRNHPNVPPKPTIETVNWTVGPMSPGEQKASLMVQGLHEGCNDGALLRWGSILKVTVSTSSPTVCVNAPIPTGFVVTGSTIDLGCPNDRAHTLGIPTNNTEICADSPYPNGYIITGGTPTSSCVGADQLLTIARPPFTETICAESPVPLGYVVTSRPNSQSCGTAERDRTIVLPGPSERVCAESTLPAGYVVVGRPPLDGCNTPERGMNIKLPGTTEVICEGSPLPLGFDRGERVHQPACTGSGINAQRIQRRPLDTVFGGA